MKQRALRLLFSVSLALICSAILSGCVYSHVKLPLDQDVSETVLGDKVGRASAESVLWLFAWGDASTAAAAKDGFITKINHLDLEQEVFFLGVYTKRTTIAYGE